MTLVGWYAPGAKTKSDGFARSVYVNLESYSHLSNHMTALEGVERQDFGWEIIRSIGSNLST